MEKSFELSGGLISAIILGVTKSWEWAVVIFILYAAVLITNLLTGIMYAKQAGTYDKEIADKAFYKKGGMIAFIVALVFVDFILMGIAAETGVLNEVYKMPFFSSILTAYQAVHELMSASDNVKKLGNKVPQVLDDTLNEAEKALNKGETPDIPKK